MKTWSGPEEALRSKGLSGNCKIGVVEAILLIDNHLNFH
jgi:hypothetical protein